MPQCEHIAAWLKGVTHPRRRGGSSRLAAVPVGGVHDVEDREEVAAAQHGFF